MHTREISPSLRKRYPRRKCQQHKAKGTDGEKSDEAVVAVKHVKACGAKGRNLSAFPEGEHVTALEAGGKKTWERN